MAIRTEHGATIEVRFADGLEDGALEGVAVRFNVVDTYGSSFAPSAFRGVVGRTVPMLWAHDPAEVIGSWTSLRATADGLLAGGKLNLDVQRAREARAMLLAGDIRGLSVGFIATRATTRAGVRVITAAKLVEISLTAFPAVPGSEVTGIRTIDDRAGAAIRLANAARAAARAYSMKG